MQLSKHFTLSEMEKSQTAVRKGISNADRDWETNGDSANAMQMYE